MHILYSSCLYSIHRETCTKIYKTPVASLGWGTPGAATEGVTTLFFSEKPGDLFLLIAFTITITFYCFYSGVTTSRVSPHTFFLPVRPRFFTILCEFAHKFFFLRVSPPGGCHPGQSAPLPVTPLQNTKFRKHAECERR